MVASLRKQLGAAEDLLTVVDGCYQLLAAVIVQAFQNQVAQRVGADSQRAGASNCDPFVASLNMRQTLLLQRLRPGDSVDAQTFCAWFDVSDATASRDLQKLVACKLLRQVGRARGTRYVRNDELGRD